GYTFRARQARAQGPRGGHGGHARMGAGRATAGEAGRRGAHGRLSRLADGERGAVQALRRPRARGGSPEPADRGTAPGPGNAFDELRFGRERILNLREILPTPEVATARAESWLREQQVAGAREVLVITGRGNSSPGGVSPVREAVLRLCTRL